MHMLMDLMASCTFKWGLKHANDNLASTLSHGHFGYSPKICIRVSNLYKYPLCFMQPYLFSQSLLGLLLFSLIQIKNKRKLSFSFHGYLAIFILCNFLFFICNVNQCFLLLTCSFPFMLVVQIYFYASRIVFFSFAFIFLSFFLSCCKLHLLRK